VKIETATEGHLGPWSTMRYALWTWDTVKDHANEAKALYLSGNPDRAAFIAIDEEASVLGFAEATLRRDWVEGCNTSPVAFLEGIYVQPEARLTGAAKALSEAVAAWGRDNGCTEYASNALLDNIDSHNFHAAIGFAETERVVYFRKELT
jgi:aminoglycoside 6'-N-acetyltransferase I